MGGHLNHYSDKFLANSRVIDTAVFMNGADDEDEHDSGMRKGTGTGTTTLSTACSATR
eukprot:m.454959 g.454959  ORF g.454959 m.454959 type:complete len:58 (-) comp20780_c0_seq1:434-607(-)